MVATFDRVERHLREKPDAIFTPAVTRTAPNHWHNRTLFNLTGRSFMILVAGSANLDFVVRAGHIPAPGETVMGRDLALFPGGKGANQAVAAARAGGATTHMLLALGNDAHATPLEDSLHDAGVQTHIKRPPGIATGTAFICVSDDGENAITVAPGANATLQPDDLPALTGVTHLVLQLETPLHSVLAYAHAARAAGVQVVLNAAPAQALPAALLQAVDWLIVNEAELASIAGNTGSSADGSGASVAENLTRLQATTDASVLVTLGSQGALAIHQGQQVSQPAFPITPIDTTGAGDTFCGAFAAQLSQGASVTQAVRFACAAAALACTQAGAQSSIPTRDAVHAFLEKTI